jgi:hypothetical protein
MDKKYYYMINHINKKINATRMDLFGVKMNLI